ncbi:hypothetical protein [Flavobacterium aquicola]|uniref:AsmA-like protein n=1 Tax=Flavobacterium aquicola TaxID=1682742 RepID=A0A3E0EFP7_9FLAO|nr:hypothetical protein [Flavobacterium aquicola]REG96099.1 hypothetical protein C8P67_11171 [Flavobacterium aquicola]
MSLTKKIIFGTIALLTLLILINFGLNLWLNTQLPNVIKQKNETPYNISYNKLKVDLLPSNIQITDITVFPKIKPKNSDAKIGVYAKTKSITITNFSIWSLLFDNIIKAKSITVDQPDVVLYKKDKNTKNIRKEVTEPFDKIIAVSNIYILKGKLAVTAVQDNETIISTQNITATIEDIVLTDDILERPIPFLFDKYIVDCDSLYYKPNDFYTIKAHEIRTANHTLHIKNFEYLPQYSRTEFVKKMQKERDIFTIKASSLDINSMDWGFKDEVFFFKAKSLVLDGVNANIYRNKIPKDDLTKKPLYNELLRSIKFPLQVDTLLVKRSKLVYEEEIDFKKGPAKLTFDHFNLKAAHIKSGYGIKKTADVDININCRFMKDSQLKVHWTFNVLNLKDRFTIKGTIQNFDIKAMYQFTKPYINASFDGVFKSYSFNITGNDKNAHGYANLEYKDLDVTLYKKNDPDKKAKVKSAVANLILKNDSNGRSKEAKIELDRIQEKSFYNFLWRSIAESLKKILI